MCSIYWLFIRIFVLELNMFIITFTLVQLATSQQNAKQNHNETEHLKGNNYTQVLCIIEIIF